jgi:threonine synthase
MARISHFECSKCGERFSADGPKTICPHDAGALYVRYDLAAIRKSFPRDHLLRPETPRSMWRYAAVLPDAAPITLHEGFTPLLPSRTTANVWIKDEGMNPTGSFKARGMSLAVTMAKHHGATHVAAPSAGNAGGALAAYAAVAGITAHVFMPKDVPRANLIEALSFGADLTLVDGLISDCGRIVAERSKSDGWFDLSSLKEPFRVEGKKTMGYELAEQLGWKLPDVIFYPTGGGVGLIGMWKAFAEMQELGWLESGKKLPKMVVVQSAGCAPIVKAHAAGKNLSEAWPEASTISAGLRVPKPYGDYIILDILKQSGGRAVAVSDEETIAAVGEWARTEGLFAAPEGAACLAAYKKLKEEKFIQPQDQVVLFNTGSGYKYVDALSDPMKIRVSSSLPPSRNLGGIIGPY